MAKKINVLVFPCGSEIGLEIHNALQWSTHIELYGASSVSSNHGKFLYKNYIEGLPFIDDEKCIQELNKITEHYNIDYIFPAHDSVLTTLAARRAELKAKVLAPPEATCTICRSKKNTYAFFKKYLRVPAVYSEQDEISYPIFLKPDVGQGSKGVYKVDSEEELIFYLKKNPDLLLLEYLPGREYTVDCFTNLSRELLFVGSRERLRISNGISVHTKPNIDDRFRKLAQIINERLALRGAWFFQIKEAEDKELVLQEIGPRVAGSMGLFRNLGVNLPLLTIFDAEGINVSLEQNSYSLEMDRALISRFSSDLHYDTVYLDFDDTVILSNTVNPWIIAYLYQCLNKQISLHLLSKHKKDIKETLKKYNLENFFQSITIIVEGKEKSDYITEKNAIFIDDSYSERQKVSQRLGIPVFDLSAIESLIDWRR